MTYQMKYFCFGTDQNVSGQVEVESLRVRHLQFVSSLNQIQIEYGALSLVALTRLLYCRFVALLYRLILAVLVVLSNYN